MTKEVLEGNKLIAEFMGCDVSFQDSIAKLPDTYFPIRIKRIKGGNKLPLEWLKFHKSWNWLMPVVSKANQYFFLDCEGIGGFDIEYMMGESELGHHLKTGNIEHVWDIMIRFIKWYNKYK